MDSTRSSLADMPWWTYVERTARGDTQAKIAEKSGVTSPSVGRWAKGSLPDPSTAAKFAREYGRPVLEAFVAAGFLTPEEARQRPTQHHTYGDQELVDEVLRRIREGRSEPDDEPVDEKRPVAGLSRRGSRRLPGTAPTPALAQQPEPGQPSQAQSPRG